MQKNHSRLCLQMSKLATPNLSKFQLNLTKVEVLKSRTCDWLLALTGW